MQDELVDLLKAFTRELPPCQEGCGRPATRRAEGSCFECGHYGNLYCDTCNVPLSAMFKTEWRVLEHADIARRATRLLKL